MSESKQLVANYSGGNGLSPSLIYAGGLTGIFNQNTELPLHTPYAKDLSVYVRESTISLIQNVLNDTLSNVINLDILVKDSIPSNTTSPVQIEGLLSHMVNCLAKNTIGYYKCEVIRNGENYNLVYIDITNDKEERVKPDTLVINGVNRKTYLLMEYYTLLYEYMIFCISSIKLANKPVFKLNELRVTNSNRLDREVVRQQIEHTLACMKRLNGVGILDAKDTIEFTQNDVNKYSIIQDIAYGGISALMGLPRTYLDKDSSGTLSTTGEGDRLLLERTLESMWGDFIEPIIARIYEIVGLERKYVYKAYKYNNLIALAEILPALQDTTLIEDEVKKELIYSVLGLNINNKTEVNVEDDSRNQ